MLELTSLFLNYFLESTSLTIGPSMTALPGGSTISSGTLWCSSTINFVDDVEHIKCMLLGTTSISLGSTVMEKSFELNKKQLQVTDAYIESLNEEQLNDLVAKLEEREKILISEENKQIKVKIKDKDNN